MCTAFITSLALYCVEVGPGLVIRISECKSFVYMAKEMVLNSRSIQWAAKIGILNTRESCREVKVR